MTSILVVEDNPLNMELVTCLLESNGIEVIQAVDGLEALDKIRSCIFDLILMDIQLPGMGGLEVLKHIREDPASQQIKVVALTAQALVGDKQRFIDAGCIGYISKPIDVFQFMDELNTFLGEGKA